MGRRRERRRRRQKERKWERRRKEKKEKTELLFPEHKQGAGEGTRYFMRSQSRNNTSRQILVSQLSDQEMKAQNDKTLGYIS